METPPRRPRRWSLRAFGVLPRVVLVFALVALVGWPESHEFVRGTLTTFPEGSLLTLHRRVPPRQRWRSRPISIRTPNERLTHAGASASLIGDGSLVVWAPSDSRGWTRYLVRDSTVRLISGGTDDTLWTTRASAHAYR